MLVLNQNRHLMRYFISFFVAFILVTGSIQAESKSMFSIDVDHIYTEMTELVQLEDYLNVHDATLSRLVEQNHFLVSNVRTNGYGFHSMVGLAEPPLGISSFLWGFCLGLPGLAVVYFITEDSAETRKALWGCITSTVIVGGFYVLWYALWASSTAW